MMNNRVKLMVAAVTALSITSAWGQEPMSGGNMQEPAAMDQANGFKKKARAQHGEKNPAKVLPGTDASKETMPGMDHEEHSGDAVTQKQDMSGIDLGSSAMDHGDMNMQGGSAPADARNPHAWSGGYTLDSGPYALPGPRQLRLADEHNFGALLLDRLERVYTNDGSATAYDAQAWFGRDYDRLVLKAEGSGTGDKLQEARTEVLWGHAVDAYWNTQLGARFDSGTGPGRDWLAFGMQGLAPYWFEIDVTGYVGNNGKTALRMSAEYELLLTQKLILQPRVELDFYGQSDIARATGSGFSDGAAGLRLRYEFTRQFAPYLGVERAGKFGETADIVRAAGETTDETRWVAGVRLWY